MKSKRFPKSPGGTQNFGIIIVLVAAAVGLGAGYGIGVITTRGKKH